MNIVEKTISYVNESFNGKQKAHFERTLVWIEVLLPDCSDAHRVAAYSHDIERSTRDESAKAPKDFLDPVFLQNHQEKGAEMMKIFLEQEGQTAEFVETVARMIERHEQGGDTEQNALMDADSISFFETNAENFVTNKVKTQGYEKIKAKIDWMFNRISSDQAKQLAQSHYDKWSAILEANTPN